MIAGERLQRTFAVTIHRANCAAPITTTGHMAPATSAGHHGESDGKPFM